MFIAEYKLREIYQSNRKLRALYRYLNEADLEPDELTRVLKESRKIILEEAKKMNDHTDPRAEIVHQLLYMQQTSSVFRNLSALYTQAETAKDEDSVIKAILELIDVIFAEYNGN